MRFKKTVQAIMKQNLNDFLLSGFPDVIYRYLTAELLECDPADLLLLHDLFTREVTNETDTSTGGLSALTKGFFSGIHDVLYGILAEQIVMYKEEKDFLPLGQILNQALTVDQKIMHEVGQLVYHDYYGSDFIERARKSKMYKYHDEIEEHFRMIREKTEERGEVESNQIKDSLEWTHDVLTEIMMIHLIDVVTCFNDANPTNI